LKKIVFLSHDGSRTGAPILLLNIIKLIKETEKYELVAVFKNGGEMERDYQEVVRTYKWNKQIKRPLPKGIIQRVRNKFWPVDYDRLNKNAIINEISKADYIINNTITNGELLALLTKGYSGKVISYIHELQMSTQKYATVNGVDLTMKLSHAFMTPCVAVKKYLEVTYALQPSKITVLNSYIPQIEFSSELFQNESNNEMLTIGCSGTSDLIKGFDIFILLAKYIYSQDLQHKFKMIWKGVKPESELYLQGLIDIEKLGLNNLITLLPADKKMGVFYNAIDILLLLSREDSYPLVVLEAASFGKPTVCFASAGGAPEFVQSDAGSVVNYLDIPAVFNELLLYQSNPGLLLQKGKIAKERMRQQHQDKDLVLKKFENLLSY
jgi:glycosyltransferase involved in cell wall biosynthesis